ncbi:MAG TPA: response regulator [Gemmatimonadales bacterium]|nr:response regulator [Gemmatimonadales bacterium]
MSRGANAPGLRVLIVDDERPARQKVRRFLAADADVDTIFEAPDGVRALELVRAEAPDVMLLDVQMPGVDGFGVVEALGPELRPHVVFVTAYEEYALRAFEAHAVDYILKPFDAGRFAKALARAKDAVARDRDREARRRLEDALAEVRRERPATLDRLLVTSGERVVLLPLNQVERFAASRNYVTVYSDGGHQRLRATLDQLEARLDPRAFVRIHRSTIVRVDRVTELRPWSHGDSVVVLRSGAQVRLSRRYRDRLERFLP